MDALYDIAAFTELAQRRFGVLRNRPLAGTELIGKAKRLKLAQASDLERMKFVGLAVGPRRQVDDAGAIRSEEHTSELQSLMRISYAVFCLKKKTQTIRQQTK